MSLKLIRIIYFKLLKSTNFTSQNIFHIQIDLLKIKNYICRYKNK